MSSCADPLHDGPVDEIVRRRLVGSELVAEFCTDCDPLEDPDLADHFEEAPADA